MQHPILEGETKEWQEAFLNNWEYSKKTRPDMSLEESVSISIKIRTLVKAWFQNYLETTKAK